MHSHISFREDRACARIEGSDYVTENARRTPPHELSITFLDMLEMTAILTSGSNVTRIDFEKFIRACHDFDCETRNIAPDVSAYVISLFSDNHV